jgi:hypothetical protein
MMKIAKRIEIDDITSAMLLVDTKKGTSGWLLFIEFDGSTVRAEASSSTVLALMTAKREFEARTTKFYKVDNE